MAFVSNRRASRLTTIEPRAAPGRPGDPHSRDRPLLRQLDHERSERRPQMKVLMGVDVRERSPGQCRAHRVELRIQLALDLGNIHTAGEGTRQEPTP